MKRFTSSLAALRMFLVLAALGSVALAACAGGDAASFQPDGVDFGGNYASHGHP